MQHLLERLEVVFIFLFLRSLRCVFAKRERREGQRSAKNRGAVGWTRARYLLLSPVVRYLTRLFGRPFMWPNVPWTNKSLFIQDAHGYIGWTSFEAWRSSAVLTRFFGISWL